MYVLNVSDHLSLSNDEGDDLTQHIIGTHLDDLSQIYNGHVTIRGSATFNNVLVSSTGDNLFAQPFHEAAAPAPNQLNEAVVQVNGRPFDIAKVPQQFWMKSVDQVGQSVRDFCFIFCSARADFWRTSLMANSVIVWA